MKKIILSLVTILFAAPMLRAENVGVPSECEDVMLQAFYWDSYKTQSSTDSKYGRTKWIDLLKDTATINANFDLVWFPPSAGPTGGGVGYSAKQYSSQDSDWGTKTKLNQLITALHAGNTRVIADVVLNHRGSGTTWCTFLTDKFGSTYGTWTLTQKEICRYDECFTNSSSNCYNAVTADRGSTDTGDNFDGARDLDHTSSVVQNWSKAYTQWLLNVMNYDGFRYDMTLGFHGQYLKMYNEAANPYLSVSELWSDIDRQITHLKQTNYNTMIFDFPLKYVMWNAIRVSNYRLLQSPNNSLRGKGYGKYAVTFIDNHDTFERDGYGNNQFGGQYCDLSSATTKSQILQAHAYILMLPGVPCVFYPHWKSYPDEINALIAVRKRAGIHSESPVVESYSADNVYEAKVTGHRGTIILRMGPNRSLEAPEGFEMVLDSGDASKYTIFFSDQVQGTDNVNGRSLQGEKFMKDGRLYIRVGEQVFDAQGRIVK